MNRTRPSLRRRNTRIEKRRAFGPCKTRKGWELRRCVTAGGAALEPPDEAVNILAAAEPDAAPPFPPDVPLCSDGIVPSRAELTEFGAVVRLVGAVLGTTVVIFGVAVTFGSAVVTFGSAVVTFGSAVVTFGSAVVTAGSVVVTAGSVVVTFGSGVLTGSVVVIVGSAAVGARAGAADGPATALLASKPRKRRTVKAAATLTGP